jgi:hypothetical protein
MSNNTNQTFCLEELALSNSHLLPDENKKAIYFVTLIEGETKKIIFVGFTENLRKNFTNHKRRIEFDFLTRMGYQINISWMLLPEGTSHEEGHAAQRCYIRFFESKLNENQNTFCSLQAEESRKQYKNCEQSQYGYLDKKIESWQQSGDDQETVIKKIWEEIKERFRVNS